MTFIEWWRTALSVLVVLLHLRLQLHSRILVHLCKALYLLTLPMRGRDGNVQDAD